MYFSSVIPVDGRTFGVSQPTGDIGRDVLVFCGCIVEGVSPEWFVLSNAKDSLV